MRNYLIQGYAEVVSGDECTSAEHVYYMPHQAVFREDSATTKLRVVFDASSHAPDTASLNECLEKCPKLNAELLPLLLQFRTERIAIAPDIAKAFLQVLVREEDRDALRFLWFQETPPVDGPLPEIQIWRMTRVPFGTTSSPFLLSATIQHHLKKVEGPLKETAEKLRVSYVDDLLTGASTEAEAERQQLAGMDLRKWASSSAVLSQRFQEHDDRCPGGNYAATTELGLLGLLWDRETDQLKLSRNSLSLSSRGNTKRAVLKVSATVFDPLGFVAPFTIRAKMLFQRIWQLGLDWDEDEWAWWSGELPQIKSMAIPRYLCQGIGCSSSRVQVHVLTDASSAAYGAVAYMRTQEDCEEIAVVFLMTKARVSPLKTLTLPRLELMGALIGCRLAKTIRASLTHHIIKFYFWTDSSIVLCWVKGPALRWKQFVKNRVTEIQAETYPAAWSHCPGQQNPADLLTRGKTMKKLLDDHRSWWGGFWERLVSSVKTALRKTLGKNRLTFEELTTVLHGVEAVINSRPLTFVNDSPADEGPLTPAHFLVGKRTTSLPPLDFVPPRPSNDTRNRWLLHQQMIDSFWWRWRNEYLLQLRSARQVPAVHGRNLLQVDDLVIVHSERLPRHMWKTGRIVGLFFGRDNHVRACPVRMGDGTVLRRPVQLQSARASGPDANFDAITSIWVLEEKVLRQQGVMKNRYDNTRAVRERGRYHRFEPVRRTEITVKATPISNSIGYSGCSKNMPETRIRQLLHQVLYIILSSFTVVVY
ncbi:uncharacterized protein LOC135384400 [Ornithodoros turicata]|uniref:uncharacterized protein LOC135384400 n=1 Tax=Ornithodoros turicata TaxID=34597 RepID=UPI00313989F4